MSTIAEGVALSTLRLGERAKVLGIAAGCRALQRARLMNLGLVPGVAVAVCLRSPGGDPTAYLVRGTTIALRGADAVYVAVEAIECEAGSP